MYSTHCLLLKAIPWKTPHFTTQRMAGPLLEDTIYPRRKVRVCIKGKGGCDLICILKRSLWLLIAKENRIEISRVAAEGPVRRLQIMTTSCLVGLWRDGWIQEMLGDTMS